MSYKKITLCMNSLIKKSMDFESKHWFADNVILAFITVFITEIFNRASFAKALSFMVFSFPTALINVLIVLTFLMLPYFLKKRLYWKYFVSAYWLTLGIVNYVVFSFRMMPFNFTDILLIPSTFTVLPVYLSVWQMILIGFIVVLLVYLLVVLYKKTPCTQSRPKRAISMFALCIALSFLYYFFALSTGIVNNRVSGTANKYNRNGFVYCFTSSTFDTGMREPEDYSAAEVASIVKNINNKSSTGNEKPNIIFLQLESFFDVNKLYGIEFSQNPVPVFSDLLEKYSHGYLNVPTYSAGTANTEFEVLTGMNVDFFGIGEYPYQTVVEDNVLESAAFCLKEKSYKTHAVHNNSATFYDRNLVYSNLGFDTFTSMEYMYGLEYNSLGWAKDMVLTTSIQDCLNSGEERDFIYAVGVQSHGTYPKNDPNVSYDITVSGTGDEKLINSLQYYVNEINEVDVFLGTLISELELVDEPCVLVVFGDHMPGLDLEGTSLADFEKYRTEYVLWSNFPMDHIVKDLESYQLYSYVLERLNMSGGTMSKLHSKYSFNVNEKYLSDYELLQYDMIYGESIGSNGKVYKPSELKLGIRDISIESVNTVADTLYVHGRNFNSFSTVFINGKKMPTEYINKGNLAVAGYESTQGDIIEVSQTDNNGTVLSTANSVTY